MCDSNKERPPVFSETPDDSVTQLKLTAMSNEYESALLTGNNYLANKIVKQAENLFKKDNEKVPGPGWST